MYTFKDTYEYVFCRECGNKYKQITTEHLSTHDMRLHDYTVKYPEAPVTSQRTLDLRKQKQGGKNHPWLGRKHSDETKKKLRESQLKNNYLRGKHLSEEHKKKIADALRKENRKKYLARRRILQAEGQLRPNRVYPHVSVSFKDNPHIRKYGAEHHNYGKDPAMSYKCQSYTRVNGKDISLRSSWEVEVAKYLDSKRIHWEYEYIRYNLGDITYCPDFFVYTEDGELDYIIEVKGWMSERSKKQISLFHQLYSDIRLEVWDKQVLLDKGIYVK